MSWSPNSGMGLTWDDSIRRHAELRYEFACAVAAVKTLPFVDALRDFTDLHRRTTGHQAGRSPAADEMWAKLIAQIAAVDDQAVRLDRIVAFMAASNLHRYDRSNSPHWPFRYDYNDADGSVRMHFGSLLFFRVAEREQPGLLSSARLPELRDNLRRMFAEIAEQYPAARRVRGGSWLYNWETYRRLYPAAFTTSCEISRTNFTGGSRWGQFHTGQGDVNTSLRDQFRNAIARLDPENLNAAFPISTLSAQAPIEAFYREYKIS